MKKRIVSILLIAAMAMTMAVGGVAAVKTPDQETNKRLQEKAAEPLSCRLIRIRWHL